MTRGSRILKWAVGLPIAAFLAVAVLAICFEAYLRWVGFLQVQPANYPCMTGDPVINHTFQPSCSGVATAAALKTEKDVTYKVNRFGYRGHEPMPGLKTILVVGDSYTEGFGLEEEESFPAVLESNLKVLGLARWQVLNGGTMGSSTAIYPMYFKKYFESLKPDLVVLNLDFSDFNDDPYFLQIAEFDPSGPAAFPARDSFPKWALGYVYSNHSALLRFLHQEWNQWKLVRGRKRAQPRMDHWLENGKPIISREEMKVGGLEGCYKPVSAVAKSVLRLKNAVEKAGGKFALHMYPSGHNIKSYPSFATGISFVRTWDAKTRTDYSWACQVNPKVVDIMRAFSLREGIPFYDSFPLVMSHPNKDKLYFDRDAHWNMNGVRVVAGDLAKKISADLRQSKKSQKK